MNLRMCRNIYKHNFRNKEELFTYYSKVFPKQEKSKQLNLASIIENQYSALSKSIGKTNRNIELLDKEKTLAIVTGQQLGILGGPLYTFYKIINSNKISKSLTERYDDYKFVPVFWLEADDHDFNEVRSINLFDNENQDLNLGYKEEISDDDESKALGIY